MDHRTARIPDYLQRASTMQLATAQNSKPWIATVYFVTDSELNLYWLSWPSRRHSRELAASANIAVAVQVKSDLPVIGLQAEGTAEHVTDAAMVARILPDYIAKYGQGMQFHANFTAGTAKHALYKFTPVQWVLFDEYHKQG